MKRGRRYLDNVGPPSLFTKLLLVFFTHFGKIRCSGFGVYPSGVKCPGCRDCKPDHYDKGE